MDDELPRVTRRHLRLADSACPRRLAAEQTRARDHRHNRAGNVRFEVVQRLEADARQAHAELRAPRPGDFPTPNDLFPEQQRVHAAAAAGYLALFGDVEARSTEAVDPFETELPEVGVRLSGGIGLAVELADGTPELRVLRVGHRDDEGLVDEVDLLFVLLRATPWVPTGRLHMVTVDLLTLEDDRRELSVDAELPGAQAWLASGLDRLQAMVADPRPKAGADCRDCPVVAGCAAHAERP